MRARISKRSPTWKCGDPTSINRLTYPPWRVFAIFTRVKEAYLIGVWIFEVCLPPKPGAIGRVLVEHKAESFETVDLSVEVIALEIERYARVLVYLIGNVDREGRVPVGTFKPGVPWERVHYTPEAELLEKFDRFYRFFGINSCLVKVHLRTKDFKRLFRVFPILAFGMFIDDRR